MNRDTDILVTALLKSIIESGAETHRWEKLLEEAIILHHRTVKRIVEKKQKQ
jgi:hypothetical protein